jgi:hypothetical protein
MSPSDEDNARTMESRPVALIVDADESSRIIYSELLQHAGFHTLALTTCERDIAREVRLSGT